MAKRNRETLKNHFRQGEKPTQQAFEDLIDSTLNTLDDGFSGSPHIGMGLAPLTDRGVIISAFRSPGDPYPAWEFMIDKNTGDLCVRRGEDGVSQPVFTMKYNKEDEDNNPEVIINGMVRCQGIKRNYITGEAPADGKWHDILDNQQLEEGCFAFDIIAGCGERNKGRYALLSATAIHCFGSRRRIRKVRSNFGLRGNRICLRWIKIKDRFTCQLQIKTAFRYGDDTMIRYQIARLWDNPSMK
ncbi:MAG TPA: hypothetical protein DEQ30_04470 [Porphyromonadaceae bacterium]|nr:hypothetical protein [Porphyromonadaceae bacterium]